MDSYDWASSGAVAHWWTGGYRDPCGTSGAARKTGGIGESPRFAGSRPDARAVPPRPRSTDNRPRRVHAAGLCLRHQHKRANGEANGTHQRQPLLELGRRGPDTGPRCWPNGPGSPGHAWQPVCRSACRCAGGDGWAGQGGKKQRVLAETTRFLVKTVRRGRGPAVLPADWCVPAAHPVLPPAPVPDRTPRPPSSAGSHRPERR